MISIQPAPPPVDFDQRVRRRGLDAIAELVGEEPSMPRPGRRRRKVADSREEIPPDAFPPFWRDVLPDMLCAYHRVCAYLSLYIERATGYPSVDHVIPKSKAWERVYEWTNYRLACGLMNARKKDISSVIDPFAVVNGWFAMEFVEYQVVPGPLAKVPIRLRVMDTIKTLRLNDLECCSARGEYVECYLQRGINLNYLKRRAPFVASELRRQGRLLPGDL
jgi:hypothetical protein